MPDERGATGASRRRRIGLLGGTFDPVHAGHLALARAALEHLALDELRFVPTGRSWQKERAGADAAQRIEMLRIAIAGLPHTSIDERETRRTGASYTIDTLIELRDELGTEPALVLLLGSDQLRNLPTWHRWDELLRHAHLGVVRRAEDTLEALDARMQVLVDTHRSDVLPDAPAGSIVLVPMPPTSVSGTGLRERIARGERPDELLPAGVLDYIERNRLYRRRNRMDPRKLQRVVVDALDDIKAQDIRVFDTTPQTELFDRVIIATGTSNRQTRALAAHVRDKAREAGAPVRSLEGADTGEWVLVDLGDIVVHVMQPAIRQYYNLEEIWGSKPVRMRIGERAPPTTAAKRAPATAKRTAAKGTAAKQTAAKRTTAKRTTARPATAAATRATPAAKRAATSPSTTTKRTAARRTSKA